MLIHSRGKFARICVELDLEKPLESHINVRGHKLNWNMRDSIPFASSADVLVIEEGVVKTW